MAAAYDAIVVGGGHNGLVAAAYLARSGARTLVLEAAGHHRRGGDHRGTLAGRAGVPGHPAVLRDEPDAADASSAISTWPGTATRSTRWARTTRPSPRAARSSSTPTTPSATTRRCPSGRAKDAEAMPRWDAWLEGLADVLGPLLLTVPPQARLPQARRPRRDPPPRLAPARPGRADDRRRDPADDDEHRRPARRLVRVASGEGRARGQRRDRHLGRPLRAGHRLRDGAPLHRRHRRRPPRQLGLPGGRDGRGRRRDRQRRPRAGARPSAPAPGWPGCCWKAGAPPGVVLDNGDEIRARWSSRRCTRRPRSWPTSARENLPDDFVARHRALEDPQRRGQDQPRPGRAAGLHRRPRHRAGRAPHRIGRDGAQHGVHRARVPGRPGGPPRRPPVQRRRHPHRVRQDAVPGGHPHHVAVHPVGARRLERRAAHRGAAGLRRPDDRLLQRGRARTSRARSCTPTSSAPTRWSTSTA